MKAFGNKGFPIYFAIIVIGLSSITAQVLFLRQLIAVLYGNELIYGIVLFTWLISYALGAGWLGRLTDRLNDQKTALALTQLAIACLLPALLFGVKTARLWFGLPQGILINLPTVFLISLFSLAPLTILFGLQFSLASRLTGRIALAYTLEAAGSVIGGLILTFIFLSWLNPFQIVFLLSALLALSAQFLRGGKSFWLVCLAAIVLFFFASAIDIHANRLAWQGYQLIKTVSSPYGELAAIKDGKDYSFFLDGSLFASTADRPVNEEIIHLSFLLRDDPKKILLIGGGLTGGLKETLKYPVEQVDYIELDPKAVSLIGEFVPSPLSKKVRLFTDDGIRFINNFSNRYDLIMLNLPEPGSALINRFYTLEFFRRCQTRLNPNGVIMFKLPGSADFMGNEQRSLNAGIYKTILAVFPCVAVIPGNSNYFFAGRQPLMTDQRQLLERWKKKNISTAYFNLPALKYDLQPERIKAVKKMIAFDQTTRLNSDNQPISYYQSLLLWTSYFDSPMKSLFRQIMSIRFIPFFITVLLLAIGLIIFGFFQKTSIPPLIIFLVGCAGMGWQIMILLNFQAHFGSLYQAIGLLTAAFMGGLTLGSLIINRFDQAIKSSKTLIFLFITLLILSAPFSLIAHFLPLLSLIVGTCIGAVFPLAAKLIIPENIQTGTLAGKLYGADLLGSSLAVLLVALFLAPIYGMVNAGIILSIPLIACLALLRL
ncbi:MAG: hypothetical protein WC624_04245 [Candidatus Margulisiibacteriota bacterium]